MHTLYAVIVYVNVLVSLTHLCRPVPSTFAVRETASLGIMGAPRVPPLNPSESIVLSDHTRLFSHRYSMAIPRPPVVLTLPKYVLCLCKTMIDQANKYLGICHAIHLVKL